MGSRATQPGPRLGNWLARSPNNPYQAATDGCVYMFNIEDMADDEIMEIRTDVNNPPTTVRQRYEGFSSFGQASVSLNCEVKKGDWWNAYQINCTGVTVFWLPRIP